MYKQAVAVFAATSAVLTANAVPARAAVESAIETVQCGNHDTISVNVTAPSRLTGLILGNGNTVSGVVQPNGTRLTTTVAADDVRGLLQSIVAGTSLRGFFSPPLEMPAMPEEMSPYAAQRPANSGFVFSPADAMSNELAGRLVACANGTPAPAATASSFSVTQLLDALVTIAPADCTTTTAQWSTAASPVASQESLLQALGVQQLLNSLIGGPAVACASRTPSDSASTTSFMDAIGVPGLLNELLGD